MNFLFVSKAHPLHRKSTREHKLRSELLREDLHDCDINRMSLKLGQQNYMPPATLKSI
jgi:hypothetical protein